MSAGAMIAIHAAVAQRHRERVLDAFRIRGATALDRAVPLAELDVGDTGWALKELMDAGVVRPVDHRGRHAVHGDSFGRVERYYLDEAALVARRRQYGINARKATKVLLAIFAGLLVAGLIALLILRNGASGA